MAKLISDTADSMLRGVGARMMDTSRSTIVAGATLTSSSTSFQPGSFYDYGRIRQSTIRQVRRSFPKLQGIALTLMADQDIVNYNSQSSLTEVLCNTDYRRADRSISEHAVYMNELSATWTLDLHDDFLAYADVWMKDLPKRLEAARLTALAASDSIELPDDLVEDLSKEVAEKSIGAW